MIVIHYPTAFKALDKHVDCYNAALTGSNQKLKTAAVATAKEIIRIYGASLLTKGKQALPNPKDLPPLRTNNQQLAGLIKCSSRSVQRYILKLQGAKIITRKVFRGSNADYELWVNPEILFVKPGSPIKTEIPVLKTHESNEVNNRTKSPFLASQRTDRLLPYSENLKSNNVLIPGNDVDSFKNGFSLNSEASQRSAKSGTFTGNKSSAGRRGPGDSGEYPNTELDPDLLNMYVKLFWVTAKNLLYRNVHITPNLEKRTIKLVEQLYAKLTTALIPHVHEMYIERLSLAVDYVRKNPEKRFIPLPYIYFNLQNPYGFAGTEKWYWATMERAGALNKELFLERLIKRYINNQETTITQRLPTLKLFRECEKKLAALKNESFLQRFYAAIMVHHGISELIEDQSMISN